MTLGTEMTPEEKIRQAEIAKKLVRAAVAEMMMFIPAMYFILGSVNPQLLADMKLPVLVEGQTGLYVGIALLLIGMIPVINVALSTTKKDSL